MFTMGQKIKDISPKELFEEQSANDYWDEGGKNIGKWFGKLSERWGVKDKDVTEEDFTNVMKHQCPWDDKPLTTATKKDGISFYPFQCACQKSVSIMAVIGGDHRLYDAHLKCVKMALSELEKFAAHRVRTGADRTSDKTAITGNILCAMFTHDSSRALDPQLHTHCNIANVTITEDGKRMALTESQMMKAVEYAGRFYQSMMARECMELGYRITTKRGSKGIEGFEIEGVSPEIIQRFSRRRAEIEEAIEKFRQEHGRAPFPAEINIMALETREAKLREISTAEVRNLQKAMLSKEELEQGIRLACKVEMEKLYKIIEKETLSIEIITPMEEDMVIEGLMSTENGNIIVKKNGLWKRPEKDNSRAEVDFKKEDAEKNEVVKEETFIAIDIGTTTLAMALVNVETGEICDTYTSLNHQKNLEQT